MTSRQLTLVGALVVAAIGWAPVHGATQALAAFSQLRLRVAPIGAPVLPLEPVPVRLSVSNDTQSPIPGHPDIEFSHQRVHAFVRHPDGRVVGPLELSGLRQKIVYQPNLIRPGEQRTINEVLSYELDRLFPTAGQYELWFRFSDLGAGEPVTSNTVRVQVIDPDGNDRVAYDELRRSPDAGTLMGGLPDTAALLERLVDGHRDSRYADYARLELADWYSLRSDPDYTRAREMLSNVIAKPSFPLRALAIERLADINQRHADRARQ